MGETVGHHEILGLLGTGGSGTVYRARDTRVGRTVAVRVLGEAAGNPERRAAFVAAARPFTQISHPNVATLFEVGEHEDRAYLVYEFVPGERLTSLLTGRPLNLRRALDLCTQVADALADAHSFGLSHGVITPTAIAVTPKGRVKVLDFGLAAWQGEPERRQTAARLADRGTALGAGAVAYMAPEQVLGQRADHRADLFALGTILYELLTGRQPFAASAPADAGVRVMQYAPPPPSRLQADIPPSVDAIVSKALAKNVADRYEHAATMAADLRAASSVVLQREAADETPRTAAPVPRGTFWRGPLLVLLLLAALAVTGWTWRERIQRAWGGYFGPELTPVVAVAPFAVGGDDVERAHVGAGISDEIARRLGHIPGMTVKGRSIIREFGGKPPVAIAAQTHAAAVLTGTIGPGPDGWSAIDLRVELANGADGRTAWSSRYRGPASDISAMQARVARDVATRLGAPPPSSPEQDRAALRLVNPDAYDAYLAGRDARATGDTAKATTLFENAIETDPSLIEAQAALVENLYVAAVFDARLSFASVAERMRRIAEEAETADPDLAPVQLARGLAADTLRDAFEHLRRAIELDRSYADAYLAVADVLRDIDPARAMRFARRAAELDPGQPFATYQQAAASLAMGQFPDTLATIARGQAMAPTAPWWEALRLRVLLARPGDDSGAWQQARTATDFTPAAVARTLLLADEGHRADAIAALGIVMRMNPDFCQARALLAGLLLKDGSRAEAMRIAADIQAAAASSADQAPWVRCAATAAAAVGDTARTAFWIRSAATDDRALRSWTAADIVLSAPAGIRQRIYPWSNVLDNAPVGYAVASMESALVRARADAARILEGLELAK